jgi:hypothetical protein
MTFAFAFPKEGETTLLVLAIDSSGEDLSATSVTSGRNGPDATCRLTTPSGLLDWRLSREFIREAGAQLRPP